MALALCIPMSVVLWELLRRRIKNLREVKWALHSRATAWTKLVCKGSALTIKGNLYLGVMPSLSQTCKGTGVWTQKERKRERKISVPFQCQEVHKGEVPVATALLTDCKTCHDFLPCILSDGFSPKVWSRGHGKNSRSLTTVLRKTFLSPLSHNSAHKLTLLLLLIFVLLPAAAAARQQGYCYNKMDSRVEDLQTGTEEHTRNPNVLASSAYSTGHRRSSLNACKGTSIPATTLSAANTTSAASPSCSWFGCSTSISISSPSSRSQVRWIRDTESQTYTEEKASHLSNKNLQSRQQKTYPNLLYILWIAAFAAAFFQNHGFFIPRKRNNNNNSFWNSERLCNNIVSSRELQLKGCGVSSSPETVLVLLLAFLLSKSLSSSTFFFFIILVVREERCIIWRRSFILLCSLLVCIIAAALLETYIEEEDERKVAMSIIEQNWRRETTKRAFPTPQYYHHHHHVDSRIANLLVS